MSDAVARERGPLSLFGVRIRVHVSWLIMALFIAGSLASGSLPLVYAGLPAGTYWISAALVVAGLAVSIVLHELAHALVGRAFGVPVHRITLFLFGGVAELGEEPKRADAELWMALAGPAFSVALGVGLGLLAEPVGLAGGPDALTMSLVYLAMLNLVLAGFNLAPVFPLDGGRVLRALIWMATRDLAKATRSASRVGEALAWLLAAAGVVAMFTLDVAGGLWWVMVGLFLQAAARGARRDLEAREMFSGHAVAELMAQSVETVAPRLTLDRFVEDRLLPTRHALYPVVDEGRWIGVVRAEDVLRVPRSDWTHTTVEQICTAAALTPSAGLLDDAAEVMGRMHALDVERMPVVHRGAVVGIVTLRDLIGSLELWKRFRPATG